MKKDSEIMELELPVKEASELRSRAARDGVPLAEFLGIHVISSAYGLLHPLVEAFRKRLFLGQSETKTPPSDDPA